LKFFEVKLNFVNLIRSEIVENNKVRALNSYDVNKEKNKS